MNRKQRTWAAFQAALRYGAIKRPDACSQCAATGCVIDGHHADYDKPLDVEWLCRKCHKRRHVKVNPDPRISSGVRLPVGLWRDLEKARDMDGDPSLNATLEKALLAVLPRMLAA